MTVNVVFLVGLLWLELAVQLFGLGEAVRPCSVCLQRHFVPCPCLFRWRCTLDMILGAQGGILPAAAGGIFRTGPAKLIFKTTLLAQSILKPDLVTNKASISGNPAFIAAGYSVQAHVTSYCNLHICAPISSR